MMQCLAKLLRFSLPIAALWVGGACATVPGPAQPARAQSASSFLMGAYLDGGTLYFEVPNRSLNTDFVVYFENERDQQVLRWVRREGKLLLVAPEVTYATQAPEPRVKVQAIGAAEPILAVLPIIRTTAIGDLVIDVTKLFSSEVPGFMGVRGRVDPERSFVERVEVYPHNVEIEAVLTRAEAPKGEREFATTRMHWSIVRLPSELMRPRLFDPRFGYWMETYYSQPRGDYLAAEHGSIVRWRLEKRNAAAPLSEPVKPIVFYVDPATPKKWWPWIRKGVEAWQPAFEAAGFRNAIIAKDPPADSTWSVNDARHSVVRWRTRGQREHNGCIWYCGGGTASTVLDPRTGEILKANVYISESYDRTAQFWYFTMAAPLDPRAHRLPLPDSLMGALYQALVTHEVGHALGLRDGSYGELTYPVDSLRSVSWLRRMSFSPSILNYSRYNYVAQPEDSIPPELLVKSIGPADIYSIRWGYTPIPQASTPQEEHPILESWAQEQDSIPWYRYVGGAEELYTVSDVSDDADPVRSTGLGMRNLRRVLDILPRAALTPRSDNRLLRQMYEATLTLWQHELNRVVAVIGGQIVQYKSGSQSGPVYTPLPADRQRQAFAFLDSMAFRTPNWLVRPDITRRYQSLGAVEQVTKKQSAILGRLLNGPRLRRMAEAEILAAPGEDVYTRAELFGDLRKTLWSELNNRSIAIDAYRRQLQRNHMLLMISMLRWVEEAKVTYQDVEYRMGHEPAIDGLMHYEISKLRDQIGEALPRASDPETVGHLQLLHQLISEAISVLSHHKSKSDNWFGKAVIPFPGSKFVSSCGSETFSKSVTLRICRIV